MNILAAVWLVDGGLGEAHELGIVVVQVVAVIDIAPVHVRDAVGALLGHRGTEQVTVAGVGVYLYVAGRSRALEQLVLVA